jgi:hypothetical protein
LIHPLLLLFFCRNKKTQHLLGFLVAGRIQISNQFIEDYNKIIAFAS